MPARTFKPCQAPFSDLGQAIRIVSYNILAPKYAMAHSSYCPPQHLDWSYRAPRLLSELDRLQADLLCLQEVEQPFFQQELNTWMQQRGYSSLFQPRRPAPGSEPEEGVSLHWKRSKFRKLASCSMCFADAAANCLPSRCCSAHAHNRLLQAVRQQRECFAMALLQHLPTQQSLLVCSAHLYWNPVLPDIKVAQAAVLCDTIAAFLREQQGPGGSSSSSGGDSDVPVVIGGDFNSLWRKYSSDAFDKVPPGVPWLQSGVYQLLQDGQLPPSHPDHPAKRSCAACSRPRSRSRSPVLPGGQQAARDGRGSSRPGSTAGGGGRVFLPAGRSPDEAADVPPAGGLQQAEQLQVQHIFTTAGLQLQSCYFAATGREPTLTTRTATFSGSLDYIWLSRPHWQVAATLELPYTEPEQPGPPELVTDVGPSPNKRLPSDHFAIGCDAVLLKGD